ncbi:MAG: hypothetical protein ER33_07275 [Cyanobium sp. CACIAM 14]|nr:MAG: hypothetical protein ER33_07275 [Cyanobium sp. CACIAM 14]
MDLSIDSLPRPAERYRLPALLQDIRLLDLLELSGTGQEAARLACFSQPTVSRRYRSLAQDFALELNRRRPVGCRYGTTPAIQLLRLSCRAHRLMAGVARLGADVLLQPLLAGCSWLLPVPPRFRPVESWLELVRQGVLDGALVSGLELREQAPPDTRELELLPLGALPLALAMDPAAAPSSGDSLPPVLVPNRAIGQGLQQALTERGLSLRISGRTCQTPAQWLQLLSRSSLAMPLPALEPASWWEPLQRQPLPQPLHLPLWLALPASWRQQTVLVHTAEQLRDQAGLIAGKGG